MATENDEVDFLLDNTALTAYLKAEAGGAIVERVLRQCVECASRIKVPATCILEVLTQAARQAPHLLDDMISLLTQLPLDIVGITLESAGAATMLLRENPQLRTEQAVILFFAKDTGATLLTGDSDLASMCKSVYVGQAEKR